MFYRVLQSIQTPQSQAKLKSSLRTQGRTHLPTLSVNQELSLRSKARKDAYDILRTSSPERKKLLSAGSAFGHSSSLASSWGTRGGQNFESVKMSKLASDSVSVLSGSISRSLTKEKPFQEVDNEHNTTLRNSMSAPFDLRETNPYFDFGRSNSMPHLKD